MAYQSIECPFTVPYFLALSDGANPVLENPEDQAQEVRVNRKIFPRARGDILLAPPGLPRNAEARVECDRTLEDTAGITERKPVPTLQDRIAGSVLSAHPQRSPPSDSYRDSGIGVLGHRHVGDACVGAQAPAVARDEIEPTK